MFKPGTIFKIRPEFKIEMSGVPISVETINFHKFISFIKTEVLCKVTKQDIIVYLGPQELFKADDLLITEEMFLLNGKQVGFFKLDFLNKNFNDILMEIKEE